MAEMGTRQAGSPGRKRGGMLIFLVGIGGLVFFWSSQRYSAMAEDLNAAEALTDELFRGIRSALLVIDRDGIRLFVDMFSAQYLNGITIDYVTNMMGSGFTFENPNATGGCGCGSSFSA